jgi:hypothetical protein
MLTMEDLLEKARAGGYRPTFAASRGWGSAGRPAQVPSGHHDTSIETPIIPQAAVRPVQSLLPESAIPPDRPRTFPPLSSLPRHLYAAL